MEPIKILTKEITPKCISLQTYQLPTILNQLSDTIKKNQNTSSCTKKLGETLSVSLEEGSPQLENSISEIEIREHHRVETKTQRSSSVSAIKHQKLLGAGNKKEDNFKNVKGNTKEENRFSILGESKLDYASFKSKYPDYNSGKMLPFFLQQTRFYHKKTESSGEGVSPRSSSGVLSKEALLNHHVQRNASHFAIFDPAMTAINLSALQPSRAGFNVRKLISKSPKENWDWGLPSEIVQVKTEGPGIHDNLIDFVEQKMRIQADTKKRFKPHEEHTTTKIRSLMKKARTMNMAAEKQRISTSVPPTEYKEKRLYRTVSNVVIPENKERSPTKTILEKSIRRKLFNMSIENSMTYRPAGAERQISNKKETNEDSSETSYQPSASYKEVFYNILNKTRRKPSTVNNLSVFNRPALESCKADTKIVKKSTLSNVSSFMSAKGKSEKQMDNEQRKSQASLNRPSMKDAPRSPFQKVKDSLFTQSAKATFSTTSKTKGRTRKIIYKKKENAKGFSSSTKQNKATKGRVTKPYIRTEKYQKRDKFSRNVPKLHEKLENNIQAASFSMQSKKDGKSHKYKSNSQGYSKPHTLKTENKPITRAFFSYCRPERNPAQLNALKNSLKENFQKASKSNETPKAPSKNINKRHFHTQHCTIFEPLQEKIFYELINLCDSSQKMASENGRSFKSGKQTIEDSCRCSLNEKKEPERKKGFFCRIARMFNVGCGNDTKCPPRGCSKCGKF